MKKTLLASGVALALSTSVAQAAFWVGNSTYTVNVSGGCFAFGDCTGGTNVGTGSFTLTTNATGDGFTVGAYSGIAYTGTPGGLFNTGGAVADSGTVSDAGQLDLGFQGRTGTAQFFPQYAGNAWNIDPFGNGTGGGGYEGFTTSSDSHVDPNDPATTILTLTGTNLSLVGSAGGIGTWAGELVSVGNVGTQWGAFTGTPYTERYNIEVTGPVVPVPAAVWLFGSGLIGLVGVARRRRRTA